MKIYISGALKGSRDLSVARALYERTAAVVEAHGFSAYVPHQHTDPQHAADIGPTSVFNTDIAELRKSAGVIAFLNEPSLGVGAEIAICSHASIPILALYSRDTDVSRFILGYLNVNGGQISDYDDWFEAESAIRIFLQEFHAKAAKVCVDLSD